MIGTSNSPHWPIGPRVRRHKKGRRHQGGPMTPLKPATGEGGVAGLLIQCSRQGLVPGFTGFPSCPSLNGCKEAVTYRAAGSLLGGVSLGGVSLACLGFLGD